jgi:hypothetical protein
VQPVATSPSLEVVVSDATGRFTGVFLGRREIPGVALGATIALSGMVANRKGHLAMLNPAYEVLAEAVAIPSPKGQH